jgi:hypothetical protein
MNGIYQGGLLGRFLVLTAKSNFTFAIVLIRLLTWHDRKEKKYSQRRAGCAVWYGS